MIKSPPPAAGDGAGGDHSSCQVLSGAEISLMLVADPGLVESANWQHQGQNLVFATASSVFVFSIIYICLNLYSLCICNFVGLWDLLDVQIIKKNTQESSI